MQTVYVGMSGGVDSSVSALLLKEQGYNVVGVYMKNWSQDLPGMKCPWADDLADAKRVAVRLGIPFEVWDFEKEYREKVVEYMLREFKAGNTPNPDIMCNQEIKFKLFYEKAMAAGADFIATGHYARVGFDSTFSSAGLENSGTSYAGPPAEPPASQANLSGSSGIYVPEFSNHFMLQKKQNQIPLLMRAVDENKDQTYFLYRISDEALSHTIFPIGGMPKPEVKKLAAEHGLHNAYKKESMGVCFVGEVGMRDFLKEYIDVKPGEIREIESDRVLGYHEGAVFYTIGQRHGLYLDGEKGVVNDGLPYYVVKKDVAKNIVYVSKNLNDENLWVDKLKMKNVFMRKLKYDISGDGVAGARRHGASAPHPSVVTCGSPRDMYLQFPQPTVSSMKHNNSDSSMLKKRQVLVRLRHRAPLVPASFDGDTLHFENKIKRPASGQSAVLYDGEICIGGGIIA